MRMPPLALAGVFALAVVGAAVGYRSLRTDPAAPSREAFPPAVPAGESPRPAPPFVLRDTDGNIVDSSQFRGKPLVINFFATFCPSCRDEIPGFVEVHRKYRDRGVEIVGISLDTETRSDLPAFMARYRIGYRIVLGDLATAQAYGGVYVIPTTFFVDRDGRIRKVHTGYLGREEFDREIQRIL